MNEIAKRIRCKCVEIAGRPTGCHLGGSLSSADILAVLYGRIYHPERGDAIIVSKGHVAAAVYAALFECGYLEIDPANCYGDIDSPFTGHPNTKLDHIHFATGSLGHGPALGLGWALAQRLKNTNGKAYVLLGDGELQEGSCWETFQIAAARKINNLVFIVDRNRAQNDGWLHEINDIGDVEKKANSFGLSAMTVDGHDCKALFQALQRVDPEKPLFVVAKTIKGKGIKAIENNVKSHYIVAKENNVKKWLSELKQ